ncbi:hypothetical protein C1H46_019957 [Malus baccata]|uniref:Uncharacterized protein n=1 Tax=Malus baccata TaxID=106549 RepID=A0A540M6S2_MALBA|nr:hypothetical protein C1H46_019957 [Malus baccata]
MTKITSQGTPGEAKVGQEDKAVDALVIQEADVKVARQDAGSNHVPKDTENISATFNDSKTEVKPKAQTKALSRARPTVVKSFDSEPEKSFKAKHDFPAPRATSTKKKTMSQTSQASQTPYAPSDEVG